MLKPKSYTLEERTIDIYLQKSEKFIYPFLKIKSQDQIKPIGIYLSWEGEVDISDCKLICVYERTIDPAFSKFEKAILQKNEFFEGCNHAENNKIVYVFNLEKYREDISLFLQGNYSLLSLDTKQLILDYYKLNKHSTAYMDSYLNPEKYFEQYALLLNVSEDLLRTVGELCDPCNLQKETLSIKKIGMVQHNGEFLLF